MCSVIYPKSPIMSLQILIYRSKYWATKIGVYLAFSILCTKLITTKRHHHHVIFKEGPRWRSHLGGSLDNERAANSSE